LWQDTLLRRLLSEIHDDLSAFYLSFLCPTSDLASRLAGSAKNAKSPVDLLYLIAQLIIGHLKLPIKGFVLKINNIVQTSSLTIRGKSL